MNNKFTGKEEWIDTAVKGFVCPNCGGFVNKDDKYCPSCCYVPPSKKEGYKPPKEKIEDAETCPVCGHLFSMHSIEKSYIWLTEEKKPEDKRDQHQIYCDVEDCHVTHGKQAMCFASIPEDLIGDPEDINEPDFKARNIGFENEEPDGVYEPVGDFEQNYSKNPVIVALEKIVEDQKEEIENLKREIARLEMELG